MFRPLIAATGATLASACPFLSTQTAPAQRPHARRLQVVPVEQELPYDVPTIKADIVAKAEEDLLNYGGFLIRLAWHCSGTYRASDGRGGCDGGRVRFDPENSWEDNAGLNDAIDLLSPIKEKHAEISWGDLIVLSGGAVIESMGGPATSFCGGRIDDSDGSASEPLENTYPGSAQLIYVNAGEDGAPEVRDAFAKMDFGDKETVALTAGGHAFGKCNVARSGFEGAWTTTPTAWDNQYLDNLLAEDWTLENVSGSDKTQWEKTVNGTKVIMLVAEFDMKFDSAYRVHLDEYLDNPALLKEDFGKAWVKLVNRDMGAKCMRLQDTTSDVDYNAVKEEVKSILLNDTRTTDFNHYGPLFVRFAWHCSGTFRSTDNRGGCNGAAILHPPQRDWADNDGLIIAVSEPADVLAKALLQPIKEKFGDGLSWADLIVISGTAALEDMGTREMNVCPGRADYTEEDAEDASNYLEETIYINPNADATATGLKESMAIMGFTAKEMTVLNGGGHTIGKLHTAKTGFEGPWTRTPTVVDNSFFAILLDNDWDEEQAPSGGRPQYKDQASGDLTMLTTDLIFKTDTEFKAFSEEYKNDNTLFLKDFANAWEKLINHDRFDCVYEEEVTTTTGGEDVATTTGGEDVATTAGGEEVNTTTGVVTDSESGSSRPVWHFGVLTVALVLSQIPK